MRTQSLPQRSGSSAAPQEYAYNTQARGCWNFGTTAVLTSLAVEPMAGGQATLGIEPRAGSNMLRTELCQPISDNDGVPVIHLDRVSIGPILREVGVDGDVCDTAAISGLAQRRLMASATEDLRSCKKAFHDLFLIVWWFRPFAGHRRSCTAVKATERSVP